MSISSPTCPLHLFYRLRHHHSTHSPDDGEAGWWQLYAGWHVCVECSSAGERGEGGRKDEKQSHWGEQETGCLHGQMPALLQQPRTPEASHSGNRQQGKGFYECRDLFPKVSPLYLLFKQSTNQIPSKPLKLSFNQKKSFNLPDILCPGVPEPPCRNIDDRGPLSHLSPPASLLCHWSGRGCLVRNAG